MQGLFLVSAGVFWLYVAHSGGDFMFARRLLPALPLALLALEEELARWRSERWRIGAWGMALLLALLPYPLYGAQRVRIAGIADEPRFYPPEARQARQRQAEVVARALEGTGARVIIEGGMASFAYYSRLPYVVEMTGLTQYSLARLPLAERGLIGHEKRPTPEWLEANRIDLRLSHQYPYVDPRASPRRHDEIFFSNLVRGRILIYRHEVFDRLAANPEVDFVPIETVLEQMARRARTVDRRTREEMFGYLDRYYFSHNGQRGRRAAERFRRAVAGP